MKPEHIALAQTGMWVVAGALDEGCEGAALVMSDTVNVMTSDYPTEGEDFESITGTALATQGAQFGAFIIPTIVPLIQPPQEKTCSCAEDHDGPMLIRLFDFEFTPDEQPMLFIIAFHLREGMDVIRAPLNLTADGWVPGDAESLNMEFRLTDQSPGRVLIERFIALSKMPETSDLPDFPPTPTEE